MCGFDRRSGCTSYVGAFAAGAGLIGYPRPMRQTAQYVIGKPSNTVKDFCMCAERIRMLEGERTFDKLMERSHSEGRRRESTSERSVGRKARRRTRTGLEHIVPDETGNSATECTGMKPDRPRGGKWGCK